MVGAPNSAPSLRSVAGLLLALALESAYEDTLTSLDRSLTAGVCLLARTLYPSNLSGIRRAVLPQLVTGPREAPRAQPRE